MKKEGVHLLSSLFEKVKPVIYEALHSTSHLILMEVSDVAIILSKAQRRSKLGSRLDS